MADGWQVEVDGEPREVELVDGMYRGVRLQPGDSSVRWHYRPPGLYWGLLISLVSLVALVCLFGGYAWRFLPGPGRGVP